MSTKAKAAAAAAPKDERRPMAVPAEGWPADQYTGKAGRFVRDPFTGKRSPAPDEPAEAASAQAESPATAG